MDTLGLWNATKFLAQLEAKELRLHSFAASFCNVTINGSLIKVFIIVNIFCLFMISRQNVIKFCWKDKKILELQRYENGAVETKQSVNASPPSLRIPLHLGDSHRAKGAQEAGHRVELCCSKISKPSNYLGETVEKILYLRPGYSYRANGFQ